MKKPRVKEVAALFIVMMIAVIIFGFVSDEDQAKPYWYLNGEEHEWEYQNDVFAFTTVDLDKYTGSLDPDVIAGIQYRDYSPDRLNLIYFRSDVSDADKQDWIDQLEQNHDFGREYPVVTQFPEAPYTEGLWFAVDNQIMVHFKTGMSHKANLLAQSYNLEQQNDVSHLPVGGDYTYIYKWNIENKTIINGITLSRVIYLSDSSFVQSAEPNLIRAYREDMEETVAPDNITSVEETLREEVTLDVAAINGQIMQGYFRLEAAQQNRLQLKVYNLMGEGVHVESIDKTISQKEVNISQWSSGIYIVAVETSKGQVLVKKHFYKF